MPRRRRSRSKARHAPPPVSVQVKSRGATIAQGLAFGTGLAVASMAVIGVVGPRPIQHETVVIESAAAAPDACDSHSKAFHDCLNISGGDVSKCQFYIDALNKCRRNSCS